MSTTPHAHYRLDIEMEFVGPLPDEDKRSAPEVTAAHHAAVEAAKNTLRAAGYAIARTGHGSMRIGTVDMDPLEIAIQRPSDEQRVDA